MTSTLTAAILLLSLYFHMIASQPIDGTFTDIPLSPQNYPSSGVSVAGNSGNVVHLFYRGPKYQLLYAQMNEKGQINSTQDLGGTLLSSPSAVKKGSGFLVSYVTTNQRVVYRTSSLLTWSNEIFTGIRSRNAPAVVWFQPGTYDDVKIYITAVNSQLNEVTIQKNSVTGNPKRIPGVYVNGSPAALYSHDEGILVYYQDLANDVFKLGSGRINSIPKLSSDFCAAQLGEGGLLILGRGFYRNMEPIFFFGSNSDRRQWPQAPWISNAPGCKLGDNSCTIIVVTSGPKMSFSQYCN